MANDNKLFQSILQSGREQAEIIKGESEKKAAEVIELAAESAENEAQSVVKAAEQKAAGIKQSALSNASLIERNAVLGAKRREINSAISEIYAFISGLDDNSYFDLIYKMAASVGGEYSEVLLNERDLKRAPADFEKRLERSGVKAALSDKAADIEGGFILKNGEIETNCSFSAIVEDKRSEIEDFINLSLFEQKGE